MLIGAVPLIVSLSTDVVAPGMQPESIPFLVPRTTVLATLLSTLREAFTPYVVKLGRQLPYVWLERQQAPLPWQYPVGTLADVLVADGSVLPLQLTARVTYDKTAIPDAVPLFWDDASSSSSSNSAADPVDDGSSGGMSLRLQLERAREPTNRTIALFLKNYAKATVAATVGSAKEFLLMAPSHCEAFSSFGSSLTMEEASTRWTLFVDARRALRQRLDQTELPHEGWKVPYVFQLFVPSIDSASAPKDGKLFPTITHTLPREACATWQDAVRQLLQQLPSLWKHTQSLYQARLWKRNGSSSSGSNSAPVVVEVDHVVRNVAASSCGEQQQQPHPSASSLVKFVVQGLELPGDTPMEFVHEHFSSVDLRIHIVVS